MIFITKPDQHVFLEALWAWLNDAQDPHDPNFEVDLDVGVNGHQLTIAHKESRIQVCIKEDDVQIAVNPQEN